MAAEMDAAEETEGVQIVQKACLSCLSARVVGIPQLCVAIQNLLNKRRLAEISTAQTYIKLQGFVDSAARRDPQAGMLRRLLCTFLLHVYASRYTWISAAGARSTCSIASRSYTRLSISAHDHKGERQRAPLY